MFDLHASPVSAAWQVSSVAQTIVVPPLPPLPPLPPPVPARPPPPGLVVVPPLPPFPPLVVPPECEPPYPLPPEPPIAPPSPLLPAEPLLPQADAPINSAAAKSDEPKLFPRFNQPTFAPFVAHAMSACNRCRRLHSGGCSLQLRRGAHSSGLVINQRKIGNIVRFGNLQERIDALHILGRVHAHRGSSHRARFVALRQLVPYRKSGEG
jgi:hypothetical protein